MIVLDASVLIAHLGAADALHDRAVELLTEVADERLGISPLTLAEVYVGPTRVGRLKAARTAVQTLGVELVPLDDDSPVRLAVLREQTGLRLPYCCVLLAAEAADGEVATFDTRLAAAATALGITSRA